MESNTTDKILNIKIDNNSKILITVFIISVIILDSIGIYLFLQSLQATQLSRTIQAIPTTIVTPTFAVDTVHIHAGFDVYIDDQLQDYSADKYMNIEPCIPSPSMSPSEEAASIQEEKAQLMDKIGDIVHVHNKDGTWGDLFTNIDVKFPAEKAVTAFVNGEITNQDILTRHIKARDRVLILIGNNSDINTKLQNVPSIETIKQSELKPDSCSPG